MLAVGRGHSWRALPIMIKKEVADGYTDAQACHKRDLIIY
jgi:hypothetical protein